MRRYLVSASILLGLLALPAQAQNTTGLVVSTCNSPTFNAGNPGPFTVDAHGNLCTNASGGGGGSVTQGTVPWVSSITAWGGGTLGAMANYGTSPGAVLVPGMNAFITNVPAVSQSGNWTSRIVGNIGGVFDFVGQNAASPANSILMGAQFQTTPTTITPGNASPLQMDNAGNLLVNLKAGGGAAGYAQGSTTSGQLGPLVQGAVTTGAPTYTTGQTDPLSLTTAGETRVFDSQVLAAVQGPVPAGTNLIGKVGVDQTTPGTTNGVAIVGVNAATALAGAGAVGTGSARVAVGQDTTTIAGSAPGTAGTASANVISVQGIASMTKLLVTPDSVALPANQSVNVAQFGGANTVTGTGASGSGIPRVTVSNDSTVGLVAGTAAIGTVTGNVNTTPTDCSGTITSGGTAQNAFTANAAIHGFTIANIDASAGSGEPLWISFTGTAVAAATASYPLAAPAATTFSGLSSYSSPMGFGMNTALSVIAATTGHKFSCTRW